MPSTLPSLTAITLGSLETAVLGRLGDSSAVYFATAEVDANLKEALRFWNALARFWRTRVTFTTTAGTSFYDLSSVVSANLGYTVTDADLVTSMEYHLLEPPTPTIWTGTEMFTLAQLTAALQRRRDQFLVETGCVLTHYNPVVAIIPTGRVQLQDSIIDVRRLSWISNAGYYSPLWRTDEWAINGLTPGWNQTSGTPNAYSVSVTPPFAIQLAPPNAENGTLDALVVNSGAELNPATPVAMGIPDDFCWAVMWGALADLLGENGPAYDPARAEYCESRWRSGIEIAMTSATVMDAQTNGIQLTVGTLADADGLDPTWQNQPGSPQTVAMAGMNILAVTPTPDDAYSITLDIVQNAPMPANNSAQILLSRDVADVIVDYAQHISAFKQQGEEFFTTGSLLERIMRLGSEYRERTGAQTPFQRSLMNRGRRQLHQVPMKIRSVKQ